VVGVKTGRLTRSRALFFAIALLVFALDRLTKYLVVTTIPPDTERGPFFGFLWIQHIQNSCAAFSLCGPGQLVFLAIALLVVIALAVYEFQHLGPTWVHAVLGLVMGGALGNGFDRLVSGSVTDFIGLHWWPTFNIADSAISIGVVVLVAGFYWQRRPSS
jgi:signal peptidase II